MKKYFFGFLLLWTAVFCFSQQGIIIKGEIPAADNLYYHRIQVGSFKIHQNAANLAARMKAAGFNAVSENYQDFMRVILTEIKPADMSSTLEKLKSMGIREVWIKRDAAVIAAVPIPQLDESTVVDSTYYTITVGESKTISIDPAPADSGTVWESSDPAIASVDGQGRITGNKNGSAVITADSNGSRSAINVAVVPTYEFYEVPKDDESRVTPSDNTTSSTSNLTEYNTEPTFRLAYRFTNPGEDRGASGPNGGIDILGKGEGNKWMWTTYYQGGFFYDLNGVQHTMTGGVQSDSNGVVLTVEPSFVYEDGVAYLQLTHKLENKSSVTVTGQRFGASSDVMIDNNDHAPLTITSYGILMTDIRDSDIASLNLKFLCKEGQNITPASTVWIGCYDGYDGGHLEHIYDNGVSPDYQDGVDSAMAFSYNDITLEAGEVKQFTVRFTLARNSN
jgi:hypothetical protein